uniref:Uncharacterized protein n=1 Tax=Anguilla anguilla TaxID=7936 RepID=A0A0E9Q6H1_ANGAN
MHSSEMRVSAQWMDQYRRSLEQLLRQLQHIPEVAAAGREIKRDAVCGLDGMCSRVTLWTGL